MTRMDARSLSRRHVHAHVVHVIGLALAVSACGQAPMRQQRPAPVLVDADAFPPVARPDGDGYDVPFFAGVTYDPAITTPATCLGHDVGARLAPPDAILGCFRAWVGQSKRVRIEPYARTYEGRELVRVVITSPENQARLDAILADLAEIADPRQVPAAELERIVREGPAVAWFGYSVHGDEVSGADASVAFGHHLIAGQDGGVPEMLEQVVVVIDPVMNPDGRARILSQIEQTASLVPNLNDASMHRGRWPWGRGNHYLFDMNRDWIVGVAPETRGRWQGLLRYHPQLIIDAHEMGPRETYLFYPYADPVNPNMSPSVMAWQRAFAADHSAAFDRHGWAYYTREWADGWFPGYTDAWGSLSGAIGILYEQSGTAGQPMLRSSGKRVTYRESVHAQAVSSLTNLGTLARNRAAILGDYLADRRRWLRPEIAARTFVVRPGKVPDRERHLVATLVRQGIEVYRASEPFTARDAQGVLGDKQAVLRLPEGTYLVPAAQPRGALVRSILELDTRFSSTFLATERAELERTGSSKVYDVTAWNLGQTFALDAYWIDTPRVAQAQVTSANDLGDQAGQDTARPAAGAGEPRPAYAWVVDGRDDASVRFAVEALERGIVVHVADHAFETAGQSFVRGSLIVRAGDNRPDLLARLSAAAEAAGVAVIPTATGRAPGEGPDLGGQHFWQLHRPRVGVLTNAPVSPADFGHIWHQIDRELGMPMSMLDLQHLGYHDLRRYTVLVLPQADSGLQGLLTAHAQTLGAWLRSGGTLIAMGDSAAMLASKDLGLSQVRLRHDILSELPLYQAAAQRELGAREIAIDEGRVWDGASAPAPAGARPPAPGAAAGTPPRTGAPTGGAPAGAEPGAGGPRPDALVAEEDAWMRRFAPAGAILRALVNPEDWLTFGIDSAEMPVLVLGDHAFFARGPVRVPLRLAPAVRLRLSGLLWPEARERLALSAYATVERVGAGQIILFASPPSFRGATPGTARLFANALVYGPSLGASQPYGW
jgi:Zinc carboxypeptidase